MKMKSLLQQKEWNDLHEQFGLRSHARTNDHSVTGLDLLDTKICSNNLDQLSFHLDTSSRMIAASQYMKRYAFLTAVPLLYTMTVYNKGLDFSIENCSLQLSQEPMRLEHISLVDVNTTMPTHNMRDSWRDTVIQALFAENISKLIHVMSKVANVSKHILWENVAIRVFSLYEKRLKIIDHHLLQDRIHEDFQYLISHAPGALFGEKRNPLSRFYSKPTLSATMNPSIRVRKTCCFYYEVSNGGEYCSNCPK